MKRNNRIQIIIVFAALAALVSCKKDYGNLNTPTAEQFLNNASKSELNNLVSGAESGMRNNLALYLDDVGTIGREVYRFSGSEPRYITDLLGANDGSLSNSNFYITNPWASRYRVVKNCNILAEAALNSSQVSAAEKSGYIGFARTIKAYQLLLNLNLTDSNGIRTDVANPDALGPIVSRADALNAIAALLDSAKTDLTGAAIAFPLAGFAGFNDAAGLLKVNRAIAGRVAIYRSQWSEALADLDESFFDLGGDLYGGVNHIFRTGSGDQLNPAFIPQNQTGETRLAHPSYAADIEDGDDRINKATLRNATASLNGLSSNRDVWVYTSSTANIPIIRNEELILIYAEANIQTGNFSEAVKAVNVIRNAHGLNDYTGALTTDALVDEMLLQRRYSLFYEGHRWIDMRRYNKLDELPTDRPADDIWTKFPLPVSEG
ncbi:RagB/SusD family nutrient uptake outer membrane protein [Panacibacter sp. DH6]|uniref:RagB/SusD family nutrient uptake outer membrane protein n=1 Tax=Panacibacter microcysteis TaxID=2793269 RepID=A0A931E498_9BACT|nr:RagB/SusD family nutrient uptake outer membrane protein [Panacibacter microcysteis]MBG9375872.1 RagB/SusD family nutrient uptake outer membrane protein [Panacibacter microcysteis]